MVGTVLLAVLLGLVAFNHGTQRAADRIAEVPRPAGVPSDAVFCDGLDGGYYVRLTRQDLVLADGRMLPAFQMGVWNSPAGDEAFVGTGIFLSDPIGRSEGRGQVTPPIEADILETAYFDGQELRFDMADSKMAGSKTFGRIIPLDMQAVGQ